MTTCDVRDHIPNADGRVLCSTCWYRHEVERVHKAKDAAMRRRGRSVKPTAPLSGRNPDDGALH